MEPRRLFSALAVGAATILTAAAPQPPKNSGLSVVMGPRGISELSYNGDVLFNGTLNPGDGFNVTEYNFSSGGQTSETWAIDTPPATKWNAATNTLTQTYAWGSVAVKYTLVKSSLEMAITVSNTSNQTLEGLNITPMYLRFPTMPLGFSAGSPSATFNTYGPGITVADFGNGAVAMVEEDTQQSLYSGFLSDVNTAASNRFETWVSSAPLPGQPDSWPQLTVPIAPHAQTVYHVSLRFGPTGSTAATLAPDVISAYAAANPFSVNWTDRRPIATLFPAGSGASGRSATNPRGWFNDPTVNVLTQPGVAQFAQRLLAYAETSVQILKSMGAQGMITWDLEGEQYPTASYIGDPRLATTLAPELAYNDVIDQYFAIFRNAGFEVGVTVRPQQFVFNNGNPYQEALSPAQEVQSLVSKIDYARQQWGCTLFYVDSTAWQDPASVLEQVHQQCAGVLLIPENPNLGDYSATAPFETISKDQVTTPASVRQVYPNSFNVIDGCVVNPGPIESQLVTAVANGDILLFQGWYNNPYNAVIKQIYQQAAKVKAKPAAKSPAAVGAPAGKSANAD